MALNSGDQDDHVEICGYRSCPLRTALTYAFIVLTGGVLRLVYHWVPHWFLKSTSVPCPVPQAQYILVTVSVPRKHLKPCYSVRPQELYNGKHEIHHVKPLRVLTPESVQKLRDDDDVLNHHHRRRPSPESPASLSVHFANGVFRDVDRLLLFTCKKVTYVWDEEGREFVRLAGLDQGVSAEVLHASGGLSSAEEFMR